MLDETAADYDGFAQAGQTAYDVSSWNCYCRDHRRHLAQAQEELLGTLMASGALDTASALRYQFLFSDWASFTPFAVESSSLDDDRSVSEMGPEGSTLVNPLYEVASSGIGTSVATEDGFVQSC
eukprot:scaffold2735_cov206-Pinguiococcus_pyrenoidosus.AAC.1